MNDYPEDEEEPQLPSEEQYYAKPTPKRPTPTPNDVKRNRGVDKLFQAITPGLPIDTDPSETRTEAEHIASVLQGVLKGMTVNASPIVEQLLEAWPTLVPPAINRFCYPGKYENGILFIYVKNSIKLFELQRVHFKTIEKKVLDFIDGRVEVKQVRLIIGI